MRVFAPDCEWRIFISAFGSTAIDIASGLPLARRPAVQHRGQLAFAAQAARFVLAEPGSRDGFEYCFHDSSCPSRYPAICDARGLLDGGQVSRLPSSRTALPPVTRTTTTPNSPRGCCGWPAPAAAPPTARRSSGTARASRPRRIVLVTISFSIGDCSIRSSAGPDSTPCTAQASTRSAPFAISASRRLLHRPGRVDDVVLQDAGAARRRRR